jgi:thioredoxin-related protein
LLPSFGNMLVYAKFKANQDEISQTICVQRKLVLNTCNGRCELQKSLKKFEDNEKQMQNNLKEKLELVYIQNTLENNFSIVVPSSSTQRLFATTQKKPISVSISTFRPPVYFI